MTRLIVGCGYLGSRVARLWQDAGAEVQVITRSTEKAARFAAQGLRPIVADILNRDSLGVLPCCETVLFAVGHDRQSTHPIEQVYPVGLSNVLAALPVETQRVIYISSTGVYGPAGGAWVDETTPPDPQRPGGLASLEAEAELAAHPLGKRSLVLRLAGLYGPGRVPYLDKLRAGEPLTVPGEGWLNLVHVDDAAAVVLKAEQWRSQSLPTGGPETFCVCDGHPVVRRDYYGEVARLIGVAPPRFTTADPAAPATARARSDKRVRNSKLLNLPGVSLRYPTYGEELEAILRPN